MTARFDVFVPIPERDELGQLRDHAACVAMAEAVAIMTTAAGVAPLSAYYGDMRVSAACVARAREE